MTPSPTGSTTVAAVIGDPIRHSRSPAILNAAFRACALDWVFAAFGVPAGSGAGAVEAMRVLGLGGLSVTMPLKAEVAAAVDDLSPEAAALGAVNCVVRDGNRLVGHNTDGAGLLRSLAAEAPGHPVAGRRCAVLGAGGAARAIVRALADAGAAEVLVVNRTASRAEAAAELAGPVGRVAPSEAIGEVDLVVNATSVGMGAGADGPMPCDPSSLRSSALVVDIVYLPEETPLLAAARVRGIDTLGGLGMLVQQAAVAFELWTGRPAPVEEMRAAASATIS